MNATPQIRALKRYRKRLGERGMARFEVLGLDTDRDLIRSLAKRLAAEAPDSAHIRATVRRTISGEQPKKGGVLNALRRSPLVGADLNLNRPPGEPKPARHQHHQQCHQARAIESAGRLDRRATQRGSVYCFADRR